jgi:hypothetical protein
MATKKRDPSTIDMFTGEVDPPVIPKNRALVANPKSAAQPVPSVPSVPLPADPKPAPAPLVPQALQQSQPLASDPDITLFPHAYLIVFGLAWMAIGVVIADNLYGAGITASVVKHRAHISSELDQYLLATVRGVASAFIAFLTISCGLHIAVRKTTLPLVRYAIAGSFLMSALVLIVIAYICEADYMGTGIPDILRRLQNIQNMKWN